MRARLIFITVFTVLFASLAGYSPAFADRLDADLFKFGDKLDLDMVKDRHKPDDRDYSKTQVDTVDDATDRDASDDDSFDRYAKLRKAWTSDFIDTDFSATDFSDLRNLRGRDLATGRPEFRNSDRDSVSSRDDDRDHYDSALDLSDDRDDEMKHFLSDRRDDDKKKRILGDRERYRELTREIPGMLHDWVPSKVDRLNNGGFTGEEGNGHPVPYNLNGWIEIDRKLPWEAEP